MRGSYLDVIDFITNLAIIFVTDLSTLHCIIQQTQSTLSNPSAPLDYFAYILPLLQSLSITLKLPLTTFEHIQTITDGIAGDLAADTAAEWLKLCPALARLTKLRNLYIWLDHDSDKTWSVVNERALLSKLDASARSSAIRIMIDLPKLHPRYQCQERHSVEGCSPPPYTTQRRLRQRYHVIDTRYGGPRALYRPDFPLLLHLDPDSEDEHNEKDLGKREEMEKRMWENGKDVDKIVRNPSS
jgi:hypothetical protein